jgi:hypothetical protein
MKCLARLGVELGAVMVRSVFPAEASRIRPSRKFVPGLYSDPVTLISPLA